MQTWFRIDDSEEDARALLDPANQRSEPWGEPRLGRCDKCHGTGRTHHVCQSCETGGADPGCPACSGRVRYLGECPACNGTGHIRDTHRHGVSVFPDVEGLLRYMRERDVELDGCVLVELEGEEAADDDFDADEGAKLIHPRRIVSVRPACETAA